MPHTKSEPQDRTIQRSYPACGAVPLWQMFVLLIAAMWPTIASALPDYDALEAECAKSPHANGCLASVRAMRSGGFSEPVAGECPSGFSRDMYRCPGTLSWCTPKKCQQLGEEENIGVPSRALTPCCGELVRIEPKRICGQPIGGYYGGVCTACGDKQCDSKYENSCNCAVDCR